MHVKLTTEYVLSGYEDQDIAYRTGVKQPETACGLIDEIMWQELCREKFDTQTYV